MSIDHSGGNIQNAITLEEHDGALNAKRVSLIGTQTIYAVVNTGAGGNVTLSDSKTYIGLVTATLGVGDRFIGLTTVVQASSARTITGNLTLSNPQNYIGLVTAFPGSAISLVSGYPMTGIVTVANTARTITGNLTLSNSNNYIGLVTATSLNAGTSKTLIPLPIAFSTTSVATIAVPTGGNALFKITQLLVNSNATTRVSIKSGATYLTGNASIGISLSPNGGWVENGSPDSPVYIGLASGAAIVVEKSDITTSVSGKVVYFQE